MKKECGRGLAMAALSLSAPLASAAHGLLSPLCPPFQVYPIQGFPDQEICDVSTKLINEHLERFSSSSRILQQVRTNLMMDFWTMDDLLTDVLVFAASDHRAGAADSRSLHVQREQLQLLRVRRGEPGLHVQIPLCMFRLMRPTTLRDMWSGPGHVEFMSTC